MIALALVTTLVTSNALQPTPQVYNGRAHQLRVTPPRYDVTIDVDGRLDEAVWREAAVLTGFSQFSPQDQIPAEDSTEILVWYSPTAMYFGIRAFERHGLPHATLAARDQILDIDDNVQLYLGTFNDARQAILLAVNPLGVQVDGTLRENFQSDNGAWWQKALARQAPDLSQDFVFASKGRLTDWGFEVEVMVPFKSLTFQMRSPQRWDFNVMRRVQHSGYEDSWTPARRASVSLLGQSGTLEGLRDVHRGLVLDVNPIVTQRTAGSVTPQSTWAYDAERPDLGTNVRWRATNNATLNASLNPDFSQVESDAGQVPTDPRARLYFPEKRPFFLDNLDAFDTPNNLVYTRTIQDPIGAAKITGRLPRLTFALLSAADDRSVSEEPLRGRAGAASLANILRVQRDLGALSRLGMTYTDRIDGEHSNRVANVDGLFAFGRVYAARAQLAASRTEDAGTVQTGPLWALGFDRNGSSFTAHYEFTAMDPQFQTETGFIARPGLAVGRYVHRFTHFGQRGDLFESVSFQPLLSTTWKYDRFVRRGDALEKKLQLITRYLLRGGWGTTLGLLLESFGYDAEGYRNVYVERSQGAAVDTVPFTGVSRLPNRDYVVGLTTPQWKWLSGNGVYLWGQDENFDEWASANIKYLDASMLVRPTERFRVGVNAGLAETARKTGEVVKTQRVLRVKTEYQISRPLFVRVVGEADGVEVAALRDDSRTNGPLLFRQDDGTFTRSVRTKQRTFTGDWLIAWQPGPGTVFFAGYGNATEPVSTSLTEFFGRRSRIRDAFFLKASYLWRM